MEQLIYMPFKCKIKLSFSELKALNDMLGRIDYEPSLEGRAMMEWAIKKRMHYTGRLINRKKEYTISLNAQDASMLTYALWCNFATADVYDRCIIHRVADAVGRVM